VADTPKVTVRVEPELTAAARAAVGRPDVDVATLVRAGLILLAGGALADVVGQALAKAQARPGPKPRVGASA
jgi:hypothetical protein